MRLMTFHSSEDQEFTFTTGSFWYVFDDSGIYVFNTISTVLRISIFAILCTNLILLITIFSNTHLGLTLTSALLVLFLDIVVIGLIVFRISRWNQRWMLKDKSLEKWKEVGKKCTFFFEWPDVAFMSMNIRKRRLVIRILSQNRSKYLYTKFDYLQLEQLKAFLLHKIDKRLSVE